ncbi:PQQ-binding-like beta-propeller repeat protein [Pseudoalteromonas viridis]|uniref:outer membrane protein assembly factor BamB family protein n=1 Tax=Pseudoalteromonas viridis TaxID=339617 RepID=UPI001FFE0816|nr:PQQ-binding-like beta-propeller repeat protein [Pseudoalteromonas viridis]
MNKFTGIIGYLFILLASGTAFAGKLTDEEITGRAKYCTKNSYTILQPEGGGVVEVPVQIVDNQGHNPGLGANFYELSLTDLTTGNETVFFSRNDWNKAHAHNYTVTLSEPHRYKLTAEYFFWKDNDNGGSDGGSDGGVGGGVVCENRKERCGEPVSVGLSSESEEGSVFQATVTCTNLISIVPRTYPSINLSSSANGKSITLTATAEDAGSDIRSLEVCLLGSYGCERTLISCSSNVSGQCAGFNNRDQVSATLNYELGYGQSRTFRATATDNYDLVSIVEYQPPVLQESNTASEVSLGLYNMHGQRLVHNTTLLGNQDILVVAHIKDSDEVYANWPSAVTVNAQQGHASESFNLGGGSLKLEGVQEDYACFKSGNDVINRSLAYCFKRYKLTKTTTFTAESGGGVSQTVTLGVATPPNLTNVELNDQVVLPNAPLRLVFNAIDDGQPVPAERIHACYTVKSNSTMTSCYGATTLTPVPVDNSGNYHVNFAAPDRARAYTLLVTVADSSGLTGAQVQSSLDFRVIESAGVALATSSEDFARLRGVEYTEEILVGALSSEASYLCRVALVDVGVGVEIGSATVERPLPKLEEQSNRLVAQLKWTPSTMLPQRLNVKARAYLRRGSTCSAHTERAIDSAGYYPFKLNFQEPTNPKVVLEHDGTKSPGVINIRLQRGNEPDHASKYRLYEFVGAQDQEPPTDLATWRQAATISADNHALTHTITKPPTDHNKKAVYCAVAENTDQTGSKEYSASDCAQTIIHNQGEAPPPAYFDNDGNYFGPYTLKIESASAYASQADLALYFKLERQVADGTWTVLSPQIAARAFSNSAPEAQYEIARPVANQRVTYRVTAFNRNGAQSVQSAQSTFTVQHADAKIVSVTKGRAAREYVVTGAAFAPRGNTVSVQQNTTGISHQLSGADITYISANELRIRVPDSIDQAYTQGGFVVGVKNALIGARYSTYNADATSGAVEDPLNYTPTVGFNGQQYLGKGNALYAEKESQTQWYRTTGGKLSSRPVVTQSGSGGDVVFAGSQDHHIYAWSEIGTRLWKTTTRGPIEAEGLVVGDDQLSAQLFYGSADGALYVLNAKTGAIDYLYKLGATVSQKPFVVGNQIWAVTEDGQVHKLDRNAAGLDPLKWGDMDSSSLLNAFKQAFPTGWTPGEDLSSVHSLLRLGYLALGRDLTRAELSFLTYAVEQHNVTLLEVANAMLTSEEGRQRYPLTLNAAQFYDQLVELMYHVSANGLAGHDRAHWVNRLSTDLSRAQFLLEVQWSSGYAITYNRAVASTLYYYYGYCYLDDLCNDIVDSDGDNISDVAETVLGTNKLDPRDGLLNAPTLALTLAGEGRINAEFSYQQDLARFKLVDVASNTAPTRYPAVNRKAKATLVYPNGGHSFYAQACIDVALNPSTPEVTSEFCSSKSAQQSVTVLDSLTEGQITPHAAPVKLAEPDQVSNSALQTHHKYQFTTGSFRVNEQGAATYSIPIALPQGIAGVTPEVSLNYNSQQPESSVAQGWQLSAGSAITRCRQTLAQDGAFKPVSIGVSDDEDRYCLDGQRLMLINNAKHGEVGAEYRTEINTQQRIVIEAGEEPYKVQFAVYGKDGSKRIYGGTKNSQAGGKVLPDQLVVTSEHGQCCRRKP